MKRTSTLQVGPILREENTHKVKRETLFEEGSRQLATAARMAGVSAREAALAARGMRSMQRMADDIDAMALQSFAQPGVYIGPVANQESLSMEAEEGSICLTTDTGETFVRTGQAWVLLNVE